MKIVTRSSGVQTSGGFGSGPFTLNLTEEQLQIISSLLFVTRMGLHGLPNVASELIDVIEEATEDVDIGSADSFGEYSFELIKPYITETDDDGNEIHVLKPENYTIELK